MVGHYWVQWSPGEDFPPNAVVGGQDRDGSSIYVGRARHNGDLLPAKVVPDRGENYVAYGGEEVHVNTVEVLCQRRFEWIRSFNGDVPPGALAIGETSGGETLYAGRTFHNDTLCIGKVHPSHGVCYLPFAGQEHTYTDYEVLALVDG